jgi:hypothetical protein
MHPMLGHPHPHLGQIEDLPRDHTNTRRGLQPPTTPGTRGPDVARTWSTISSGTSTCRSVLPCSPDCFPGRRPVCFRTDRGTTLTRPSEEGGLDEFCEFTANRRSNSSTRSRNRAISAA